MPVLKSSGLLVVSVTVTQSLTPSNRSAEPNLPAATRVASRIVPLVCDVDESTAAVPDASSKPRASTRPGTPAGPDDTTRLTALPMITLVPETGFEVMTRPAAIVALGCEVLMPTVRPAPVIAVPACAVVRPATGGTLTRG